MLVLRVQEQMAKGLMEEALERFDAVQSIAMRQASMLENEFHKEIVYLAASVEKLLRAVYVEEESTCLH